MQVHEQQSASPSQEIAQRGAWERPAVKRIDAGSAEGAGGGGTDNVVFS